MIHAKKVKGPENTRYISLTYDIEYVIDSIYTTILKAKIEANFNDIESHMISAIKLNRGNVSCWSLFNFSVFLSYVHSCATSALIPKWKYVQELIVVLNTNRDGFISRI